MNTPVLELDGVTFAYGHRNVISDIRLTVDDGEFVGLLGPNGSGKSTLLKLLCGCLHPKIGQARLQGRNLRRLTPRQIAQTVGVVSQDAPVAFGFTVGELVLMGRHPFLGPFDFETDDDLAVAREAMRLTDVARFAERRLHEISGGERQRVLMASALAQTPRILLLDEPTAMLDIKYQAQIIRLLRRLNRERRTTIVVTLHDVNLAAMSCQRLVILKEGRLLHNGPPQTVLTEENLARVYDVPLRRVDALLPLLDDEC